MGYTACNRVAVRDISSSKLGAHHVVVEDMVKGISLDEMFQRMYNHDFNESENVPVQNGILKNVNGISHEDRQFMKLVENGIFKQNVHYVVPLPFRNQQLLMPNNIQQAMKRLLGLKKRFSKDDKLFQDYKAFMTRLLENGYAKRSDETPIGKTWYIPHHGVYHPSKPGKIRVVCDCSAEYEGKSISKELIPGPDLTNQIVGVLMKFREERIAIMADVEAMYYQVCVPENQQTYLKFLWWEEHNLKSDPKEYVMCVHVFGGTSSGCCSNYALRRTAVDNEGKYRKDAAETLVRNFHVDDLLKSMEDVDRAKQLVDNVIKMCKAGGFNLTKFVSNNKELLLSIPESKRRQGVKDQDLSGDLPTDKALGICWDIANDTFKFKIKVDGRKLTKRTMLSMVSSIYDPLGFASPFVLEGRRILQRLCNQNLPWDKEVDADVKKQWSLWTTKLKHVEGLSIE